MKNKTKILGMSILSLILLLSSVSAYEILGEPATLAFKTDGTFSEITPGAQLEAGAEVSPVSWVLIQNEDGTYEYIPQTFSYALQGYMGIDTKRPCSDFNANDPEYGCQRYIETTCQNYGLVIKSSSCTSGTCEGECESSYKPACTRDSDCDTRSCEYCVTEYAECDNGRCTRGECGSASDCGMGCTNDQEAKEMCFEQYEDSFKTVKSARCSSDGDAICVPMPRGDIECTRSSDCKPIAEDTCTYGYSSYTCNKETNCDGDIAYSTCAWNCENAPSPAYICGDGICNGGESVQSCPTDCKTSSDPVSQCGNGYCEAGETSVTCLIDCGSNKDPVYEPEPDDPINEDCSPGFTGDRYCRGSSLVRDYVYASCKITSKEILDCENGCENGVCLSEPVDANGFCGDGICDETRETTISCSEDCGEPTSTDFYCGDGICDATEDSSICPADCGTIPQIPQIIGSQTIEDNMVSIVVLLILIGVLVFIITRGRK